ncbi:PEP-CTERM sorting domain-containing protein [uncultured Azohydromonas sp.]|mgnify:CR=1 FL=1|jgi:Predicted integral membrane proteins containing uncharacterized repeats|uniref:PEP-CTERM sorting domain-containing protein n=1 Tax=uncultured Azohydromonas sp. TaxID=487342 RepID=UPI00261AB174|nr:PEP-CTERM sorting domain-containing protein [uncultured Azohydromonas sp.]
MKTLIPALAALVLSVGALPATQAALPQYRIESFAAPPEGVFYRPSLLNNAGQVAGYLDDHGTGAEEAFLYSGGTVQRLGTLGGANSQAMGLNQRGEVTGYAFGADGIPRAFVYRNGRMSEVLRPPGAAVLSSGLDINEAGQVLGYSQPADGIGLPFLSDGRTSRFLDVSGLGASAEGIEARVLNDRGDVLGYFGVGDGSGDIHPFLYRDGRATALPMPPDLPPPSFLTRVYAVDLNNAGQALVNVVETIDLPGDNNDFFSYLYSGGTITRLGDDEFEFLGGHINEKGWVVGSVRTYTEEPVSAIALYRDGEYGMLADLVPDEQAAQWALQGALAMNDRGQILGQGTLLETGEFAYFIATPVPEPATALLALAGLAVLGAARRRHAAQAARGNLAA